MQPVALEHERAPAAAGAGRRAAIGLSPRCVVGSAWRPRAVWAWPRLTAGSSTCRRGSRGGFPVATAVPAAARRWDSSRPPVILASSQPRKERSTCRSSTRPTSLESLHLARRHAARSRRHRGPAGRRRAISSRSRPRASVAVVAVLIVIILIALLVHSCQVSARNNALRDYTSNVDSVIQRLQHRPASSSSSVLSSGGGQSSAANLQNQINQTRRERRDAARAGQALRRPRRGQDRAAEPRADAQMRRDGITNIAAQIQPALGSASQPGRDQLDRRRDGRASTPPTSSTRSYTRRRSQRAARSRDRGRRRPTGSTINGGQFLPDVQWLTPDLRRQRSSGRDGASTDGGKVAPGLHGHALDTVSVGGTTLQTGLDEHHPGQPAADVHAEPHQRRHQHRERRRLQGRRVSGTSDHGQTAVARRRPPARTRPARSR